MAREWSYELVGDGMVIRRDYSEDDRGFVTIENEVRIPRDPFDVEVQATVEPDTYDLVDFQGRVLNTFTVAGVDQSRISKGEIPQQTIIGTYGGVPVVTDPVFGDADPVFDDDPLSDLLPNGKTNYVTRGFTVCACPACTQLLREGANMDRDQVARIAADIGSSLMPDNSQWMNRFTIESTSSSRTYTVAQRRTDGVWGCSCPSWINRRHCKHLVDILARLAKLTEFDVTDPVVLEMLRSARVAYLDLDEANQGSGRFTPKLPTYKRALDL